MVRQLPKLAGTPRTSATVLNWQDHRDVSLCRVPRCECSEVESIEISVESFREWRVWAKASRAGGKKLQSRRMSAIFLANIAMQPRPQ